MGRETQEIHVHGLALSVTGANVLLSGILIAGMVYDQQAVSIAVVSGAIYFAASTVVTTLILSGQLVALMDSRQRSAIERRRMELMTPAYRQQYRVVDDPMMETPALPEDVGPSYVAPVEDSAYREAVAFVVQLYGPDGLPDPKKVHMSTTKEGPGRLRIKAPSRSAVEYLLNRRVLVDMKNGYRLNVPRYPTIQVIRAQLQ